MSTKEIITAQYRAALAMMREAIDACTDSLWDDPSYPNRFWHIAFHAIFYTHLYLHDNEAAFVPWAKHRSAFRFLGDWPPDVPREVPDLGPPYRRDELLEYLELCRRDMEAKVPALDLDAASGFDWLPFSKLELQLYNLRHLQHHTGQLVDRLRSVAGIGVTWIGTKHQPGT